MARPSLAQPPAPQLTAPPPSLRQINKGPQLDVALKPEVEDYSDLPAVLIEAGFKLTLFREEEVNLDIFNQLETINSNIFVPAMRGNDVKHNIDFLKKSFDPAVIADIETIVKKIQNA